MATTPITTPEAPRVQDADFAERHKKDLGAKRFISTKAYESLMPLAAMGLAGVVGYFTLGGPIRKLFPSTFNIVDHVADVASSLRKLTGKNLQSALDTMKDVTPEIYQKVLETNPNFKLENLESGITFLKHTTEADVIKIKEALNIATKEHDYEKWAGAAGLGILGGSAAGTFVGYDKWKKEESTRLAASEIDRDISQLEVLSKRDPELVAENQRLRTMLEQKDAAAADKPHTTVGSIAHQGPIVTHQQQIA